MLKWHAAAAMVLNFPSVMACLASCNLASFSAANIHVFVCFLALFTMGEGLQAMWLCSSDQTASNQFNDLYQ
jgi:hypothetical protein